VDLSFRDPASAFLVVVTHVISRRAHGKAPHLPRIVGFQEFRNYFDVLHSGFEPHFIAVSIEYRWHPVVDSGSHGKFSNAKFCQHGSSGFAF
jgi:hypothetical protein